jgi:hypothetical protein
MNWEWSHMKRPYRLRKLIFAPLIYVAAVFLLVEEWFWDMGTRLFRCVAAWPPIASLEERIRALRPYPALCLFVLPAVLLFPIKILALLAIASGHAVGGVCAIVVAKLGGAAAVARLYVLTRPALLTLAWFARWHDAFIVLKTRWVGRLKETIAYRRTSMALARMRRVSGQMVARVRGSLRRGRHASHPSRVMRRMMALWRARRR